jgi:hypothetical protein
VLPEIASRAYYTPRHAGSVILVPPFDIQIRLCAVVADPWDNRDWQARRDVREKLFWLAAEACLGL